MANWIDKTVSYISPEAGVRRARARVALEIARAYDAAKSGRRTEGWTVAGGSANTEVSGSLTTLRNRSRDLVRNNPHARRAINTLVAKSVGTGIRGRLAEGAKASWEEFVDTCDFEGDMDFYGLQSLMARCAYESGEVLVRRIRTREGRVPLQLQVLEPDYLDSSKFGPSNNGDTYIMAGVEVDRLGRRVAYWLYDQHPGDSALLPRRWQSKRVRASEIIHFGRKDRPGQLRFVPELTAAILRLKDYDDWREAIIVKKKIEACFVAFVTGDDPATALGEASTEATTGRRIEGLSPGMFEYVGNNREVTFGNPSSSVDGGFSKEELHAIAMASGVTYEQMTGDLSGVNYSSIRAGMADFRDLVEMWRWIYFIPMNLRRIYGWFTDAAWTAGSIRSPRYPMIWTPPAWPYVNPVDDIKAAKEEIKGGIQSLSEKIRERGYDPDEVFKEIQKEREMLAELGIKVDTDAGNAPAAPAAASSNDDEEGIDPETGKPKPKTDDNEEPST